MSALIASPELNQSAAICVTSQLRPSAPACMQGPELLIDIRDYDYSLDVWGMGCMLAALVFKRPVFFR